MESLEGGNHEARILFEGGDSPGNVACGVISCGRKRARRTDAADSAGPSAGRGGGGREIVAGGFFSGGRRRAGGTDAAASAAQSAGRGGGEGQEAVVRSRRS